jgi:hypothetical protein
MRKEGIFHLIGEVAKSPYLQLIYVLSALVAFILAGGAPEHWSGGGG